MRLMLGTENTPSLLVEVSDQYNPDNFKFEVINGGWRGSLINNQILVDIYGDEVRGTAYVICDDQDRLRGNYQEVFDNFGDPTYKYMPEPMRLNDQFYDDDIPF